MKKNINGNGNIGNITLPFNRMIKIFEKKMINIKCDELLNLLDFNKNNVGKKILDIVYKMNSLEILTEKRQFWCSEPFFLVNLQFQSRPLHHIVICCYMMA